MYSQPLDTVGARNKTRESTYSDTIEARYESEILGLARWINEHHTAEEPLRLEFSPEARRVFLAWTAAREELLTPYGPLRHMAEWVAKCDSTTARLAGILHVGDGINGHTIEVDTVRRAIEVGDYWTDHARSTFDIMGASDDLGHARFIHEWLANRTEPTPTVTFRDIQQHAKKRIPKVAEMVPAVEMLIEYGWLRQEVEGDLDKLVGKGKSSPTFAVHPMLSRPPQSPTSPTVITESDQKGEIPPSVVAVGDVGDVGLKHPSDINSSSSELLEGEPPESHPTSPTSDDDFAF
jgi:hypothetical protein